MKKIFLLFYFSIISSLLFAQDTYVRPSVSIINIDYNNQKSTLNLNSVQVPSNLDYLKLSKKSFKSNTNSPKILLTSEIEGASLSDLKGESKSIKEKRNNTNLNSFISQKISNAAITAVVPIKNGEYDYSSLDARGVNSATDQDVNLTSQNMGQQETDRYLYITDKLLNKNYVVAFNMARPVAYSDKYKVGFEGSISYVVFKIENIYNSERSELNISAKELPRAEIKAKIISSGTSNLQSTKAKDQSTNRALGIKAKTDSELKKDLTDMLVDDVWNKALREVDDFQPRTTLLAKRKVALGTKENLKIDNRFFIYENVENRKGEIVKKKRATMRVKKVAKNDGKATGDSEKSKLYKIGYGKAKEGMLVQQKEDIGVGISLGYGTLSWARVEYRLKGITPGLLFFAEVNPFPGNVEFDMAEFQSQGSAGYLIDLYSSFGVLSGVNVEAGNFSAFALNAYAGMEKQIRLGSALYFSPFIGAGYSTVTLSGDVLTIYSGGDSYSLTWDAEESSIFESILAKGGARLGLQLSHALSANFTLSYLFPVTGGWMDPKFTDENGDGYYNLGISVEETDQTILSEYYEDVVKEMPAVPDGIQTTIMLRYEF